MNKPLQRVPFFIRLLNWEYWPFTLVYLPVFAWWFLLALRHRSLLFFTATNPGIPTGGLVGESKRAIMAGLPAEWKPAEILLPAGEADAAGAMARAGLRFPVVLKPDVGERGLLVAVVHDAESLEERRRRHPVDFLLQEYVDLPEEVSVLHHRFPGAARGGVTSVTLKRYLSVTGDGVRPLGELIRRHPRALLQWEALRRSHGHRWEEVLPAGETLVFHTIGNHAKGTQFLNGNDRIAPRLVERFDRIAEHLPGVHYARYDIKCRSWEDLLAGRDFRILEVNGVKSEPAHIYDPDYPIWRFYADVLAHWRLIGRISRANRRLGHRPMPVREAWDRLVALRRYHQRVDAAAA